MNWIILDRFYYPAVFSYPQIYMGFELGIHSLCVEYDNIDLAISGLANAMDVFFRIELFYIGVTIL